MQFSQYTRREMGRPWPFIGNLFSIDERNREYYRKVFIKVEDQFITITGDNFTVDIHFGDWIIIDNNGLFYKDLSYLESHRYLHKKVQG